MFIADHVYEINKKNNDEGVTLSREERLRRQGRTKILPISEEWVLTDFVNRVMGQPSPDYSTLLADNKQVPPDVVIGRVHHNVFYRTFEFQVFHETFEPVPEGMEIQRLYPLKMMDHVSQVIGKVSLPWYKNEKLKKAVTQNGSFVFHPPTEANESNTPIMVGGTCDSPSYQVKYSCSLGDHKSSRASTVSDVISDAEKAFSCDKFSLRLIVFSDVPEKEIFYSTKYSSRPGFLLGTRQDFANMMFSQGDMVFVKADNPDDPAMPFYYDHGQLKSRYNETGNNIVTKFDGTPGVLTRDKIDNTTQWATDRGIAAFFSPSGPMADQTAMMAEDQEPAVVEEKKVKFREWL
jgi:hypothetical protein